MKTTKIVTWAFAAAMILSAFAATAQGGHYYTVTTWKIDIPEDGSRAEFNQLMKNFSDKVVKNNDKVISEKVMFHISGSDMRDVVVITEYASWADIDAASITQNELMQSAWPDEGERSAFMKSFFKYVVTHSDEIYRENPDMAK